MAKGIENHPFSNTKETHKTNHKKESRSYSDPGRNQCDNELNETSNQTVDCRDSKGISSDEISIRRQISERSTSSTSHISDIILRRKKTSKRFADSIFSTATFAYMRRHPGFTLVNIYILKILFWDILVSVGDVVTDFLRVDIFCF